MLPTFGVPERIPRRDVAFVVAAGLPLTIVFLGIVGSALDGLGIEQSADDPVTVLGTLAAFGLGPAIAYRLEQRLRASHVSLARGCLGLVAWTLLLTLGAGVLGWIGVGLVGALGGGALLRPRVADGVAPSVDAMTSAGPGQATDTATSPPLPRDRLEHEAMAPTLESKPLILGSSEMGDAIFYAALFGAIGGMILGGVVGLATNNSGLKAIDDRGSFLIAVGFAAVGVGFIPSLAWEAVVAALSRGGSTAIRQGSTIVVAILAPAIAAMLFMLVAQSLAGPVALVTFGSYTAWFFMMLIWDGIKSRRRPS